MDKTGAFSLHFHRGVRDRVLPREDDLDVRVRNRWIYEIPLRHEAAQEPAGVVQVVICAVFEVYVGERVGGDRSNKLMQGVRAHLASATFASTPPDTSFAQSRMRRPKSPLDFGWVRTVGDDRNTELNCLEKNDDTGLMS